MAQYAQPLNQESVALIEAIAKSNLKPYYEVGVEDARKRSARVAKVFGGEFDFDGETSEVFAPRQGDQGKGVPMYVYKPKSLRDNPPIWIYFHGGGHVVGSRENVDTMCKIIAQGAECIVVNAQYRLAPEHTIPANMDDGCTAATWVLENKTQIGGSASSAVGVGGDSAGGTIAAATAHDVPRLSFQMLIYPRVVNHFDLPSHHEYKDGPILPRVLIDWFHEQLGDVNTARFASYHRDKFDHLPPALFVVAECDPLRDESYEYSMKLTAAGIRNQVVLIKGAVHAFIHLPAHFKQSCKEAYDHMVAFLRQF